MRKLFTFNLASLDGFFEGPNHNIDWHGVDAEVDDFAVEQLNEIDTLVLGRATYEGFASFWPTPVALENDPVVAQLINGVSKIVASRSLKEKEATWENTRLVSANPAEELARLKQQPGKDIAIFGSANLIASLMPSGLIDEHRVMINPVLIGRGTPLFNSIDRTIKLKLLNTRTFGNGNVLLVYGKGA